MTQGKQIYYNNLRKNLAATSPRFKELAVRAGAYRDGANLITSALDEAVFVALVIDEIANILAEANRPIDPHDIAKIKSHLGLSHSDS